MPPDLLWCGQCHTPRTVPPPSPTSTKAPIAPVQTMARPWARPEPFPVLPTSRWKGGPTTFGPAGRVGWTLVVLVGLLGLNGLYGWTGPMAPIFLAGAALAVLPILRAVWRKDRVG